jgi:putative transposase
MQNFDYSKDAIYFTTPCCKNRINHFGEVVNGEMQLNEFGEIANLQIIWLEKQYPYVILHNYVVMPNHVHILFEINRSAATPSIVGTGRDLSLHNGRDLSLHNGHDLSLQQSQSPKIKSVSSLMGAYKTTSSKLIHEAGNINFVWQRSFHDHIVRNQRRYDSIYNYIDENPLRWEKDVLNKLTNPDYMDYL